MATTICVVNDKGGVAKTTTVANLGTALWLLGKRVLLIDTDMQCNLTVTIDNTAVNQTPNLLTWMAGKRDVDIPIYERYPGLDFIPSDVSIGQLELYLQSKPGGDLYMKRRLDIVKDDYDYILIDCAPGCKSKVNTNALFASDYVIIPIRSDLYSVTGRSMLTQHIEEIRESGSNIKVMGALLTQFDGRTEMGKLVKEHYTHSDAIPLFPITIRRCEDCNKAPAKQQTTFEYNASCIAADDYMRVAERIVSYPNIPAPRRKNWTPQEWNKRSMNAYNRFIEIQKSDNS